jgi:hypothetical protein
VPLPQGECNAISTAALASVYPSVDSIMSNDALSHCREVVMDYNLDIPQEMESAKRWTVALLSHIHHGGMWFVPRSDSVYIVDHEKKELYKVQGRPEPSITRVATAIGWTVTEWWQGGNGQ